MFKKIVDFFKKKIECISAEDIVVFDRAKNIKVLRPEYTYSAKLKLYLYNRYISTNHVAPFVVLLSKELLTGIVHSGEASIMITMEGNVDVKNSVNTLTGFNRTLRRKRLYK